MLLINETLHLMSSYSCDNYSISESLQVFHIGLSFKAHPLKYTSSVLDGSSVIIIYVY